MPYRTLRLGGKLLSPDRLRLTHAMRIIYKNNVHGIALCGQQIKKGFYYATRL